MLQITIVALLFSSASANIPLEHSADNINLREKNIPLEHSPDTVNFREKSVEHSAEKSTSGTKWPWSIADEDIHPKFVSNEKKRVVEVLTNTGEGAGYMGELIIGGQPLVTIWDTGSDQQVVNSVRTMNMVKPCMLLQQAHCYNDKKSQTYKRLSMVPRQVSYGSGDTFVLLGQESMKTKAGEIEDMPFYELLTTNIPNILSHEIDVVGGLAPRGWNGVTLIKEMGVDRFSFCFPADNQKNGYLIWNDTPAPAHFNRMTVAGANPTYWSLPVSDFALSSSSGSVPLNFKGECIVDSGTSLITLDEDVLNSLTEHINKFDEKSGFECNEENLHKYPNLVFNLGGKTHRFRPNDYIMYTETEEVPDMVKQFMMPFMAMQGAQEPAAGKKKCVLMFTPPMEKGTCILGMPFMRNYYTTFNRVDRTVETALHDGNCNMGVPVANKGLNMRQKLDSKPMTLKRIDVSKLQFSTGFMSLWSKHQANKKSKLEITVDKAVGQKSGLLLREKLPANQSK